MAKEKRAVEAQQAIQEMSANLFYAKLRGEAPNPADSTVDANESKLPRDNQPNPDFSSSVAKGEKVNTDNLIEKVNLDSSNVISGEDVLAAPPTREVSYSSPILSS